MASARPSAPATHAIDDALRVACVSHDTAIGASTHAIVSATDDACAPTHTAAAVDHVPPTATAATPAAASAVEQLLRLHRKSEWLPPGY